MRRSPQPSAQARQHKLELLRTLQVICANLRALQAAASTADVYREVEDLLGREIARLRAERPPAVIRRQRPAREDA